MSWSTWTKNNTNNLGIPKESPAASHDLTVYEQNIAEENLHRGKLTNCPWKLMVGRWHFLLGWLMFGGYIILLGRVSMLKYWCHREPSRNWNSPNWTEQKSVTIYLPNPIHYLTIPHMLWYFAFSTAQYFGWPPRDSGESKMYKHQKLITSDENERVPTNFPTSWEPPTSSYTRGNTYSGDSIDLYNLQKYLSSGG